MSSKITFQALALAGIIAVSGLPAFASDMTPGTPAPAPVVQSNTKASVPSAPVGTNVKADTKVLPTDKKDSKDVKADAKTATDKVSHEQTAKLPTSPTAPVPAPSATMNGAAAGSVQH